MANDKAPRQNRVAKRWGIQPDSPFVALPDAYFDFLCEVGVTPYEERILTTILRGWRWGSGMSAPSSCAVLARAMRTSDRRSIRKGLKLLAARGVIGYYDGSKKAPSEVNIEPLINKVRAFQMGAIRSIEGGHTSHRRGPYVAPDMVGTDPIDGRSQAQGLAPRYQISPEEEVRDTPRASELRPSTLRVQDMTEAEAKAWIQARAAAIEERRS